VGIGTSSPSAKLELSSNNSAGTALNVLRFNDEDGTQAPNQPTGRIEFYHNDSSAGAGVASSITNISQGSTALGELVFATGSDAERMRIDSDGRALYGTTDTTLYSNTSGNGALINGAGGEMQIACNNGAPMWLNRMGNDGEIIKFYKAGEPVGSIGTDSGDLTIYGTVAGHTGFRFGNGEVYPTNNAGSLSDNTMSLGSTTVRFKDAYLSGGVYLGGTGAANKLDDYEEGTFTPTVIGGTTAGTVSYANQQGSYVKTGKVVTVNLAINWASHTGAGQLQISSLPFSSKAGGSAAGNILYSGLEYTATPFNQVTPFIGSSSAYLTLWQQGNNVGYATLPIEAAGVVYITISYETA